MNLRTTANVKLIYFQDPTLKGHFYKYCGKTVFHLSEELLGSKYLEVVCFCKNLRTTANMKLIYLQDPTLLGDFDKCGGKTVFHLSDNLVGNQYLEIVRILVPPQILVPLPVSAKI